MSARRPVPTVVDVMTTAVHVAGADLSLQTAARLMIENGVSALPVMDRDGRVIGLLSETGLLPGDDSPQRLEERPGTWRHRWRASGQAWTVREAMSSPIAITPSATIGEAVRLMRHRHVRHLLVVDADGRLRGIISRGDLLRIFLRHDRDITRHIVTEVLPRASWLEAEPADVRVEAGVVRLRGGLERRSQALLIERLVASVEGVVTIRSELTWQWNDLNPAVPPGGPVQPLV